MIMIRELKRDSRYSKTNWNIGSFSQYKTNIPKWVFRSHGLPQQQQFNQQKQLQRQIKQPCDDGGVVGGSWSRSSVSHSSKRDQLLQQQQCSKFHNHYTLEHFQSSGGIVQSCCLESGPPPVNWNWLMNGWMNDWLTEWMNEWKWACATLALG